MVMISEGFYTRTYAAELPQIAGQASRAGVTIYTVNARGTQGSGGRTVPDAGVSPGNFSIGRRHRRRRAGHARHRDRRRAYRHSDDLASALNTRRQRHEHLLRPRLFAENTALDGKFRKIELKQLGRPDIRARRGYVATPLPTPRQLRSGRTVNKAQRGACSRHNYLSLVSACIRPSVACWKNVSHCRRMRSILSTCPASG